MLWFSIAHYVLRSWPWVVTALASLVLIPDSALQVTEGARVFIDHERAYPRLPLDWPSKEVFILSSARSNRRSRASSA